jgi:hypothetical protein
LAARPTYQATAILTDVASTVTAQTDGGVVNLAVQVLAATAGFGKPVKHDFDNTTLGGGCRADHYSVPQGKLPPTDLDGGPIVFTGFEGGTLLDGTTAPSKISCALEQATGLYRCAYGDLVNGMPGPATAQSTPFPGNAMPLGKDTVVTANGMGGADVGPWTGMSPAKDPPRLTGGLDLSTVKYDPTQDFTIAFDCPTEANGACGLTGVVAALTASDQPPGMVGQAPQSFGTAVCFGVATGGTLTVNKGALAALFGCDANGASCDANLKSVQTVVLRIAVPSMVNDPNGSTIQVAAGHGVAGLAPR